ncbi:phosphatidate cytidylyltransferase [Streptomyces sp. RS10V-4]|uniref:phosphatidate cytidylyltransferase n=1 Tax=Streptomyces rhizoryzae TaxID=2932493 RepID=UPI0020040783|nr:phosphatidate cytidylyltransferase [Streptomyces rhizoryzae]MCK7625566.1 phosphatidate cytidylyltransferase [Streptomyces rhizoryzae]
MNESSWGTPPGTGRWGPPDHGPAASLRGAAPPAPAGPVHDRGGAAQTRPMPIVPEPGGHQDDHPDIRNDRKDPDDRGAARLSGPLFRDDRPQEPMPTSLPGSDSGPEKPQKKSAGRNLRAAIGVGAGLGVVILASLFVYKPVFIGVIAIAVVVGLWELTSRLAERKDIRVPLVPLAVGGTAMVVAGYVRGAEGAWVAMALTALAVLVWRMTEDPRNYLRDVTAAVFAAFYVPFLATFVALMLAAADDGPERVVTFLLLTVVSDTGAYAVGWRFGKKKLAPRISPGKTREGLVGAVLFAMVAGALCMEFLIKGGAWWQGLLLGLAVAASATLGDLGESMIKRDLGIKDMGTLLPGHGGIMDRLDSLLPTAPVVWLLFVIFVGSG